MRTKSGFIVAALALAGCAGEDIVVDAAVTRTCPEIQGAGNPATVEVGISATNAGDDPVELRVERVDPIDPEYDFPLEILLGAEWRTVAPGATTVLSVTAAASGLTSSEARLRITVGDRAGEIAESVTPPFDAGDCQND